MAEKIVDFQNWCFKCQYFKNKEADPPCDECLDEPVNEDSHRPVYFKEKADGK